VDDDPLNLETVERFPTVALFEYRAGTGVDMELLVGWRDGWTRKEAEVEVLIIE